MGFRPALVYDAQRLPTEFNPQTSPVDLFFLFDASASQDSQIQEMLKQAKEIVKLFAGDSANKDICHVGSALFLGPNIRLMCSKKIKEETQTLW